MTQYFFLIKKPDRTLLRSIRATLISIIILVTLLVLDGYAFQNYDVLSQNRLRERATPVQFIEVHQVENNSYTVSMNVKDMKLTNALRELTEQINVGLSYDYDADLDHSISCKAQNADFYDVLDKMLNGTGLEYLVSTNRNVLVIRPRKISEDISLQHTVRGSVMDAQTGEPLPGVNIIAKGTTTGTTTDADGFFEFSVSNPEATLVISYIGYQRLEIPLNGQEELSIDLNQGVVSGEEVVVVGYGSVRKSDLTGSVSSIRPEDLMKTPVTNINNAIQGRAAGVHVRQNQTSPGGNIQIRVRGINSFMGNNDPLYIIDGIVDADIETLNSTDIQSIEILKDASSTAIYGARGANGVVSITTKTGEGSRNTFSFNSYMGWQNVTRKLDMLNAFEWASIDNERSTLLGFEPIWDLDNLPADIDWFDEIFKTSLLQNYNLSTAGGVGNVNYYTGVSYVKQDGVVVNTDYERFNLRLNLDSDINDRISIGSRIGISRDTKNNMFGESNYNHVGTIDAAYQLPPLFSPHNEQGNLKPSIGYYTAGGVWEEITNPLHFQKNLTDVNRSTSLSGNVFADIEFLEGFSFRPSFNYNLKATKNGYYNSNQMWMDGEGYRSQALSGANDATRWNTDIILSYQNSFNTSHNFNLLGGFVASRAYSERIGANVLDFGLDIFDYHQLSAGETINSVNSTMSERKSLAFISRINYDYQNKYYFTFNSRYDGSSVLGPEHKWGFFPSGAIMWRLSTEEFIKRTNLFYDLTLRASYGISGSEALGPYSSYGRLAPSRSAWYNIDGQPVVGYVAESLAVPDLKWEETAMLDIGLEASFLNGRLGFVIDYYKKNTTNLFLALPVPVTSGVSTIIQNAGSLENSGVEINVNAIVLNSELSWSSDFNIAFQQQEVTNLAGLNEIFVGTNISGSPGNNFRITEGQPLGTFYGYVEDGIWQIDELAGKGEDEIQTQWGAQPQPGDVKYVDLNNDGFVDVNDRKIIGHALPKFFGGWNNTFFYKQWDASLFFDFTYGNDLYNAANYRTLFPGTGSLGKRQEFEDYWTPENPDAFVPALNSRTGQYFTKKRYLEDGSFLRLKELTIGYTLPFYSGSTMRLFTSATNLFMWTKATVSNPESNVAVPEAGGSVGVFNVDYGGYPYHRTFTIGLNVKF